ncbi:type VII secretion-associated serine protease mycosin, partial [Pseudonocardia abyssalis]
ALPAALAGASVPAPGDDLPAPPPVRVAPPAGDTPGPAPGLRSPRSCAPPPAGPSTVTDPPPSRRLQLAAAHRIATGAGVLIAVIDTGVAPHARLGDRLRGGGDYLTGGDGLDDCDGHGTAVAGLLAASPAGDDEVVGIAPGAEVLSIRQSSPSFSVPAADGRQRPAGDVATLAEAVVLAVRSGADVVNVSEAVCLPPEQAAVEGTELHAALRYAADADVVVVAAAGNTGVGLCAEPGVEQVALPGWYDEPVTVGATGPDDAAAPFTVAGPWVDIAGPGTGMRSLAVGGGVTADPVTGTSFSAPLVAGLAALVRERFPELSAAQVADRILATARRPAGGHDEALGLGVLDPLTALTAEPAVLRVPDASGEVPTAVLAGTAPGPGSADEPLPPVDLAAPAALLAAAAAVATRLRKRPPGR